MQRRGRKYWTKVIRAYEASSGETHAEFADRHGVERATFERWLYLLRRERESKASAVRVLPVQIAVQHDEAIVVVELGGGMALRVTAGTEPSYVAALVTALRPC